MKRSNDVELPKLERKTIEKRRIHMKWLCFKLASLIPHHFIPSKDMMTQQDQLHHAASYIETLKGKIEELKVRKELAISKNDFKLPYFKLSEMGSSLELVLISGLSKNFMLHEIIRVFHEEGAEVVNATFSIIGNKKIYTIHAQVKVCRVGVDTSRVSERLNELVGYVRRKPQS